MIVKLHTDRLKRVMLDNNENDRWKARNPRSSMSSKCKRRAERTIHRIQDPLGNIYEAPKGII
jgi:hypothetical protein